MACLICLEELNSGPIKMKDCNCNLLIHRSCYEETLKRTRLSCPICRIHKKSTNSSNQLMELVFKLPPPLAIMTWVLISFLFSILIAPLLVMKLSIGNNLAWSLYFVYLYSIYFGINTLVLTD